MVVDDRYSLTAGTTSWEGNWHSTTNCLDSVKNATRAAFSFYDPQVAHTSPVAKEALERIGALYAVESDIQGRSPKERREMRNARGRPLLESLKPWLEETLGKLSRESDTAIAVR